MNTWTLLPDTPDGPKRHLDLEGEQQRNLAAYFMSERVCETCAVWKRWGKHPQIQEQHHWGTCKKLKHSDDFISIEPDQCQSDEYISVDVQTNKAFGCLLWEAK